MASLTPGDLEQGVPHLHEDQAEETLGRFRLGRIQGPQ